MKRFLLPALAIGTLLTTMLSGTGYATPTPAANGPSHPVPAHKPPPDTTPPQPATELRMAGNDAHSISLRWVNPTAADFAGVLIRRAVGHTPPVSASDGTLVAALGRRQTSFTDKHLAAATSYSYAVFPRDKKSNVGIAATLITATRSTSTATGLRGKVTDAQGRAIAAVQVEVRDASSGNGVAGTATTSTGQFSVTGLAPGNYLLCFFPDDATVGHSPTGYLPGCYRQQPYGYGDSGTPVAVRAGKLTSGLVDYLPVAGAIAGRVTDSAGHGLAGVSVSTYDPTDPGAESHGAITGADGRYAVRGLSAGSYQVCFYSQGATGSSTTGYLDECYDNQPAFSDSATPVPVRLERTSAGIDAALDIAGAITGRVTDPAGAPLAGISASVFGAGYGDGGSDSSGAYTITGLPAGSYTLCFDGSYLSTPDAPYGYTNSCAGGHWLMVDVTAGHATTVNGTVERAGAIGGTVTGNDGPLPGVWVSVFDSSGNQLNSVGTGDDGSYQITGLAPDEVTVCFDPTFTTGGYQRACYGATGAGGAGAPVAVTAGQLSTADVQLVQGASITGTITDASGDPISGVLVNAYGNSQFNGYFAQTDENGSYTIGGVIADDYRICFDPSGARGPTVGGYAAECYNDRPSVDTADLVTVGVSGSVTVDAALSAGAGITGQVTGSDGAVLGGVYVYAYNLQSGQGFAADSDHQDGSYRLSGLTAGDYAVCFNASLVLEPSSTGYVDECYDDLDFSVPGTPVHVVGGAVATGIDAELAVAAAITGSVTDSAGTAIPNVFVQTNSSSVAPVGTTDDLGRYRITGLPAGPVTACFFPGEQGSADNGTGFQSECYYDQPDASTATPVATTAGQVSSGVDAELAEGAAITGRVTDSAGNGVRDASVYTYSVDGSQLSPSASTDETGRYRLVGLPASAVVVCFRTYPDGGANGTGYQSECYDDQPDVSTANPVTTTAGQVSSGVDAELADAPPA